MDLQNVLVGAQEALTVHRVFGEPITVDHTTMIPTASIGGGGGGGANGTEEGGAGFGMRGRPAGMFVLRGDAVTWKPAIDVNRIVLGGQILGMTALLVFGSLVLRRARS